MAKWKDLDSGVTFQGRKIKEYTTDDEIAIEISGKYFDGSDVYYSGDIIRFPSEDIEEVK